MTFTFCDLFAGIGGFRLGLEAVGGKCVESIEYNKFCVETYTKNFGDGEIWPCDIREVDLKSLKDFDVLCAGFPCQPFSMAGISKRNSLGRPHGFDDQDLGNLFWHIMRVVREKQPKVVLLENVKNLKTHDKGRTFATIHAALDEAGYDVYHEIIDAALVTPQHRERIFIVAIRQDCRVDHGAPLGGEFVFPEIFDTDVHFGDIMDYSAKAHEYTLSDKLWQYLQDYKAKHKGKGNGFGYSLVYDGSKTRTLSARYGKDGSEILVWQPDTNPRKMTPRECARLQGFPESFKIPVSNTQAYKQFGNAVCPLIVQHIGRQIVEYMKWDQPNECEH